MVENLEKPKTSEEQNQMVDTRRLFAENGEELKAYNRAHPPKLQFLKKFYELLTNRDAKRVYNSMIYGCRES